MIPRVVLVFLLVTSHVLVAQEYSQQEEISSASKRAISFSFNGLHLRGFEGGIGVKSWASSRTALVAGIEFYHESSSDEHEDGSDRWDDERTRTSMGASFGFQRHSRVGSKVSPYVGLGLGAGWSHRKVSHMYPEEYERDEYESTSDETYVSGNASFGIEYFIANDISLSGQHSFKASYSFGTLESGYGDDDTKVDQSGLYLGLGTSGLILSIYF